MVNTIYLTHLNTLNCQGHHPFTEKHYVVLINICREDEVLNCINFFVFSLNSEYFFQKIALSEFLIVFLYDIQEHVS